jgi:Mycoplasma protein of unknown function, DUF285
MYSALSQMLRFPAFLGTFKNSHLDFQPVIAEWDTSAVTDMSGMVRYSISKYVCLSMPPADLPSLDPAACMKFSGSAFNTGSLNGWNVRRVTDMQFMVSSCLGKNSFVAGQLVHLTFFPDHTVRLG